MLMADDRSEPMGFDGSTFVDDDDGLTLDLNLFWEILAEDNKSDPPEQQVGSAIAMMMADDRSEPMGFDGSTFVEDDGGLTLDLSLFWEILAEDNKSDPPEQQDASTTQLWGSLSDWMSEVPPYDYGGAGSKSVFQNFTTFSTDDSKRTPYEQPNCTDSFSFPAVAVNAHSDWKPEAVFQFLCPQGNSNSQYGEHSTFLGNPDINYQPFTSMKQLDCKEDEGDSKLIQRSSIDTQISKASCRTVHTTAIVNSFDDDADVCIIENLSDPSRASRPINTNCVASHAAVSDSVSHMGMGGTKFRANDERLIFHAVVQEMMVCEQCGDAGFENAYVYCVNCLNYVIHRYCLPSLPVTFDEFVNWLCVDCETELGSGAGAKGAGKAPE